MNKIKNLSLAWHIIFTVLLSVVSAVGAAGDVDASFNAYLAKVPGGAVSRTVIQPDGKIIACGQFTFVNGVAKTNIVRLNADGTLDTTFNSPPVTTNEPYQPIQAIALQADGKIVIAGYFSSPRVGLARLNSDGTPDTAFNNNPTVNNVWFGLNMKVAPDGKILFYGYRSTFPMGLTFMRFNPDGSLDVEDASIHALKSVVQPDGKMIYYDWNNGFIRRLNTDLSLDGSFATVTSSQVNDMVLQPDGKVILGGNFTQINGGPIKRLARINADGTVDVSFNVNTTGPDQSINSVALLPGGKMYVGGAFSTFNGAAKPRIALINADGTLDASFTPVNTFANFFYEVDVQTDGKILASSTLVGAAVPSSLPRFNTDGSLDGSFQAVIGDTGKGSRVLVQPDNKILVSGDFSYAGGAYRKFLARFNADGTLDTGFNQTVFNGSVAAFDIFPDGKIVLCGDSNCRRLNTDGSVDITYSIVPPAFPEVKALPDGKALFWRLGAVYRYNANGTVDNTFVSLQYNGQVRKILPQPDGKILISGDFDNVGGTPRGRVARLNADGTLDASFNPPAGANDAILDLALQPDGKVIVGGLFTAINFNTSRKYLARLNSDGSLDGGFVPAIDNHVLAVRLQPDGRVLIGGLLTTVDGAPRLKFARVNSSGNLDNTFVVGSGANNTVRDIDLQSDGKIIMVGDFSQVNGFSRPGIVRLLNAPSLSSTPFDFDGDGKADVSVYRPSTNRWYIFKSSDSTVTETTFGIAGDVPVPADFDGDGKTDIAIFRPSSGDWWSLSSQNGAQIFAHWGANGDIPRPSDFDGDGRADYVVFRPSDNFWYRISSGNGASSNGAFGLAGDKPVTGDFDGDGKSDKAIYRPSAGTWWYQSSINGAQLAVQWGISTDIPAPADFDGDGKTDFAVYRPSTGVWYVINSSNGSFLIMAFGIAEDKPVPADYDGDGKADIAVFRPSTGTWYQMKTTAGFAAQQFGVSTDIPTENAFVP